MKIKNSTKFWLAALAGFIVHGIYKFGFKKPILNHIQNDKLHQVLNFHYSDEEIICFFCWLTLTSGLLIVGLICCIMWFNDYLDNG